MADRTSIPLLRRVRFKDGRAPLEVVRPGKMAAVELYREISSSVEFHRQTHGDKIGGYAIVSWNREGDFATSLRNRHGVYGAAALPGNIADAMRDHITRNGAAADDERHQWPDQGA